MIADQALAALRRRGWTLAVAESLTGGGVCDALVSVPGASAVLLGGVVAYATDVKRTRLGVDAGLLATEGAVHPEVARQMADGVRSALAVRGRPADVGVATTGVAGPDPQDGRPPGTVHVAVSAPHGSVLRSVRLAGDRSAVRGAATALALALLLAAVEQE